MALSALPVLFSEKERPRAVGVWAAANFLALPIGPILGGWLLSNYWWGWVFLMNVPVSALGLIAVIMLLPESRAPQRPGLDPVGVTTSTAGLAGVTYGLIEAGQNGWGDARTLLPLAAGAAVLVAFVLWERSLNRRPGGQPLIDLALFSSPSFTWGVILAAIGILAMMGLLFTMPQYFQGVLGTDAQGSGLRLLPMIAGMIAGAVPADRLAARIGAKITVALGFVLLAVGLFVGVGTGTSSSMGFVALWMAVVGAGVGLAMTTAASAALSRLPAERSGVGSALMQAFQKIGAPFGSAILGSVLSSAYQARLNLAGLSPAAAKAMRESIFGGVAVAGQLHSPALLHSVRAAFVHGMDVSLLVATGIAAAGVPLALAFLPARSVATGSTQQIVAEADADRPESERGIVV
jgi:predicted MFS family arabinose efflux permease